MTEFAREPDEMLIADVYAWPRIGRTLAAHGVMTMADLAQCCAYVYRPQNRLGPLGLYDLRHFGPVTVETIRRGLVAFGLDLLDGPELDLLDVGPWWPRIGDDWERPLDK